MPTTAAHVPVAVVGAGPVGLTLANLLGGLGVATLLVERNLTTVQEPRAVSIDDESLRTMQAAGLAETVLSRAVPGYGSHYFDARRRPFARVEPTGRPFGYPRRNAFRQPVLEGQLRDGLARFHQVETLFGWRLDRFEAAEDRVTLHLAGPQDTPRIVTCDYLIGCDGASSLVRERLGLALSGTTFDERWLILDLEDNENIVAHTEVFCDRRRPCITLPGPERTRRFEFKLLDGETDAELLAPAMVERLLRTHGADPRARLVRKTVYRFHARVAPAWRAGRVLLAGDAAHLTPPFAGQGMNSGIRDAHNLAWKLAAVLRGQLGAGLLDSYADERRDHVWQMVRLALRMGRVMSPRSWLDGFLTQSAFRALAVWPPARDYVAQMKYKPPPRFHAGFLAPDRLGRASMIGRLLPQPMVRRADGSQVLLDEVLGQRFVLVAQGADAVARLDRLRHPVWDRLGVLRVALADVAVAGEIETVAPADSLLSLGAYREKVLLLRPDHYVAAAISDGDAAARDVDALTGQTC